MPGFFVFQVPFFVRDTRQFESTYTPGSHARHAIERQVEADYYERVHLRCQGERMTQHRLKTWGNAAKAAMMAMPACDELGVLNDRLGSTRRGYGSVIG
jgi:hypothetical protein